MFVSERDYKVFDRMIDTNDSTTNQCHINSKACYEEKYSSWDKFMYLPHWQHDDDIVFAIDGYDKRGDYFVHEGKWPGAKNNVKSYLYRISSQFYTSLSWMEKSTAGKFSPSFWRGQYRHGKTFTMYNDDDYCEKLYYSQNKLFFFGEEYDSSYKYKGNDMTIPFNK